MRQFPDRSEWQDHINQHRENLVHNKASMCSHPQRRCADTFESVQELKYHLQDVHCVELRKGCKRFSPDSEVNTGLRKIKSPGDTNRHEACVKQEYKFVNEAAKLRIRETFRESTSSSITFKPSTPTSDWNADLVQRDLNTPPSSTYSDEPYKIDPRLLAGATLPSVGPSIYDAIEVVDLTKLDPETTHPPDSLVPSNECRDGSIGKPDKRQQDLEHPSIPPVQPICNEPADIELDYDQSLVERLFEKRVRRFRRHKVVQILAVHQLSQRASEYDHTPKAEDHVVFSDQDR